MTKNRTKKSKRTTRTAATKGFTAVGGNLFIVEEKNGSDGWLELGNFKTEADVLKFITTGMINGKIDSLKDLRVVRGSLLSIGPSLVAYGNGNVKTVATPRSRARHAAANSGAQAQA